MPNEQDEAILDEIYDNIEKAHKTSSINHDTIMFSIEDVEALVKRFIFEHVQKYKLIDIKKHYPIIKIPKGIAIFSTVSYEIEEKEVFNSKKLKSIYEKIQIEIEEDSYFELFLEKKS